MADGATARNRTHLLVIFAIAFASLGGSYLLFYLTQSSGVWGTTNNGEFVSPALHVSELELQTADGAPFSAPDSWWLWVNVAAYCDAECEHALHQLRQLHVLLNKEAPRVQRALVTAPGFRAELEAYPRMNHLIHAPPGLPRGIYIVDPIGNLVLRYPLADAGAPVLDDLKRLLKLSQIG